MGIPELLDILLASAVFYLLASALRASRPRATIWKIMAAGAASAATYATARVFGLYLLEQVLRALLLFVLIGAVVAFQADIRRIFDRVFAGRGFEPPKPAVIDTLIEAVSRLAELKTGALIAIRGREPWEHHLRGGVELQGAVSAPLLYSIFDTRTPGHDGAVLIEGDRITSFAAHLPLADDLPEASRFGGTRHAAALGLSQECDALVVVVSEERGVISIARGGRLIETTTIGEVREHLLDFWKDRYTRRPARLGSVWRHSNLPTAAGSLALASVLWFLFAHSPDRVFRSVTAPIEFRNLPDGWMPVGPVPTAAQVEVGGSNQSLRRLDEEGVTVSIDLSAPQRGLREIVIDEDDLGLPSGVELVRVYPAAVEVRLERARSVDLPVVVPLVGRLREGLELVAVRPEPGTLTLTMPDHELPPREVATEPLDLRQISGSTTLKSRLRLPEDSRLPDGATTDVVVHVETRPNGG